VSSWAFLVRWVSQPCASSEKGRLGSSNLRCLPNHVEVNFLSYKCVGAILVSSGLIRLLDFLI
jgi:hypothetical protein